MKAKEVYSEYRLSKEIMAMLHAEGRFLGSSSQLLFRLCNPDLEFDTYWIKWVMGGSKNSQIKCNVAKDRTEEVNSVCHSLYGDRDPTPREYAEACLIVLKMSI